ncbi:MAG: endonuclease/exonuclease/phosphatase family protein [Elainellaceae cyanobacterium]
MESQPPDPHSLPPHSPQPHSSPSQSSKGQPSKGQPSRLGRGVSQLILVAIALLTLWAYVTSFYGWTMYLELFSHFQMQYLGVGLLLLGLLLLLRHKASVYGGVFLCALLSMPILSWYVAPVSWLNPSDVAPQMRLLVANVNIQNQQYDKVLALVRAEQPDVAIFVEVDERWKTHLDTLGDRFPYSSGQTNPHDFEILIYSVQPLQNTQIIFGRSDDKASVITQLTVADQPITLLATHPPPPITPSLFHSRNRQMNEISQYLAGIDNPVILAGDLNTTIWSPYHRQWVKQSRLHNARDGFGILPTWPTPHIDPDIPSWFTRLFHIPIDHFLVSTGIEVTDIHTGADTGSDHKPLIVDLRLGF